MKIPDGGFLASAVLLLLLPVSVAAIDNDPAGDALGPFDVVSSALTFQADTFEVRVKFSSATKIVPPSGSQEAGVYGYVDFDTDENAADTDVVVSDAFHSLTGDPPSGLGVDRWIDLGSEKDHPGFVDLYRGLAWAGKVPIIYGQDNIVMKVPAALLGNPTAKTRYTGVVGSASGPSDAFAVPFGVVHQLGDLDGNGCVDRSDLDALMAQIHAHSTDSTYDLNRDGKIDIADARFLVLHFTNPGGAPCVQQQ